MDVLICIGSSCHLKGSPQIIELMKENLEKNGLTDKVNLGGSFCFGQCASGGVTIKVGEKVICGVTVENFDQIFRENILIYK